MSAGNVVQLRRVPQRFFLQHDYALGYIALSVSSAEERILGTALCGAIGTYGGRGRSLLDIGCADARLTLRTAQSFQRTTVFEPNPFLYSLAMSRLMSTGLKVFGHASEFPPDVSLLFEPFDTVVASHILYHVDKPLWEPFFRAISSKLRAGGLCLVVLWNNDSEARHFAALSDPSRWLCCSEDLAAEQTMLKHCDLEIAAIKQINPVIKAHNLETSSTITSFLLGNSLRDSSRANVVVDEVQGRLASSAGLGNSQSIVVLQKR